MTGKIITREKHLDHMVRVVPLIVFAYAIQCYFISHMSPIEYAVDGLLFLGGCLGMMIAAFVTYDLTHVVKLEEEGFVVEMKWLGYRREMKYSEIKDISVSEPGESFSTFKVVSFSGKKFGFYFVDDAVKIQQWMEEKRAPKEEKLAA